MTSLPEPVNFRPPAYVEVYEELLEEIYDYRYANETVNQFVERAIMEYLTVRAREQRANKAVVELMSTMSIPKEDVERILSELHAFRENPTEG